MCYDDVGMKKYFRYYDIIVAIYASALLVSNIAATKLTAIGPLILDGGAILFPLVYIFDDILTEVYGYRYARRAIWTAFGIMLVSVLCFTVVGLLPPAAEYHNQEAYQAVLGFFPRIVAASLIAFLVGSFINSYVLAKLKIKTKGKHLWLRLIGSTVVGTGIDTVIFCLIAFGGEISSGSMLNYIAVGLIFKTFVEVLLLPITYRIVAILKQREKIDQYDTTTNFTPFKIS